MKRVKKYSLVFDLLLMLNFASVIAVALGASISDGDAKLTIIACTVNTLIILLCRMTDRQEGARNGRQLEK